MKFIESIAKKSENRDSFWNRLSRRLDQLPTPAAPNTLMPSSSGSRDTEIFAFFQGNLARLQGLLANLIAKGSQRVIIGKLTDALSITQRSSHVSSLNEAQMSLLRDLHSSINARREATATANLNNSANYNGSSVGSSGSIAGSNNSRQRPASNQNCGPQYNQNIVPNGPAYNQNSLQGSSAYSQNIMSKSSTFNQNSSSSGPSYNQNSAPLGSTHNQNGALRGQPYIQNDIPRDQFYNQNTCVPSGPMYNPNSAPNGSMHNHNGTSRGLNGNLTNGSEYQNNPQINSAFSQNAHSNAPNGATYNHSNTSNSTTYSQNNASNCTAYHQYAAPSGPRYIQNSLPSDLSYNQQSIHSNALTYSHNGAPSDGMYSRNNAPIAVHNQNNALINISYDQSSTLNNPTYIQTSALLPSQEPTTQAQAQAQIVQIQIDRLSSETAWVKDFYDKVHSVLQVVVSLSARVLSFSDSLLLGEAQSL